MSTESKHTPGPWKFEDGDIVASHGMTRICEMSNPDEEWTPTFKEQTSNTRLIEAAPDLLAEYSTLLLRLKSASRNCFNGHSQAAEELCHEMADFKSPAIAKAKGEPA